MLTLCVCECHAPCPLAGRGTVVREVWQHQCTCPGSGRIRQLEERAEARGREIGEVVAGIRREGNLSAEEIEARLRAVHVGHGEPPPPGLAGWARVVAAGTGPRGTRTPRLLWMGLRSVGRTIRWAWQPEDAAAGSNRTQARKLFQGIGVAAMVAATLTALAVRSSGWRRLSATVAATLLWAATVWAGALGTSVAAFSRFAEEHPAPVRPSER